MAAMGVRVNSTWEAVQQDMWWHRKRGLQKRQRELSCHQDAPLAARSHAALAHTLTHAAAHARLERMREGVDVRACTQARVRASYTRKTLPAGRGLGTVLGPAPAHIGRV